MLSSGAPPCRFVTSDIHDKPREFMLRPRASICPLSTRPHACRPSYDRTTYHHTRHSQRQAGRPCILWQNGRSVSRVSVSERPELAPSCLSQFRPGFKSPVLSCHSLEVLLNFGSGHFHDSGVLNRRGHLHLLHKITMYSILHKLL